MLYAAKAYGLQAGEWKDVKYLVNLLRVKRASSNFKQKDMIIPRIWAGRRLQNPSATAMISGQLELSFQQLGKSFSNTHCDHTHTHATTGRETDRDGEIISVFFSRLS